MIKAVVTAQQAVPFAAETRFVRLARIAGFAALLALASQVRVPVPFSDVPMTLQLLAVLLAGFMLSPRDAAASVLLFLAVGATGLPVFSPGSAGVFGSTGGYLVGFLVAAVVVALATAGRRSSLGRLVLAGAIGSSIVLGCGVTWRALFFGGDLGLALATGFWPFLPKAMVELAIAVGLVRAVRTRDHR